MLGHPVQQLIRVRIGPVQLGSLGPGEWRYLTNTERKELMKRKRRRPRTH
jgi:23S rRNA pseudouridine2605 synthase